MQRNSSPKIHLNKDISSKAFFAFWVNCFLKLQKKSLWFRRKKKKLAEQVSGVRCGADRKQQQDALQQWEINEKKCSTRELNHPLCGGDMGTHLRLDRGVYGGVGFSRDLSMRESGDRDDMKHPETTEPSRGIVAESYLGCKYFF